MEIEFRCHYCFGLTDGAEFCSDACERLTREYDEETVVYPVESKPAHLGLVS